MLASEAVVQLVVEVSYAEPHYPVRSRDVVLGLRGRRERCYHAHSAYLWRRGTPIRTRHARIGESYFWLVRIILSVEGGSDLPAYN